MPRMRTVARAHVRIRRARQCPAGRPARRSASVPAPTTAYRNAVAAENARFRGARLFMGPVLHVSLSVSEMPDKIKLALNLKTAKAIGLKIPKTMLLRADEVIE